MFSNMHMRIRFLVMKCSIPAQIVQINFHRSKFHIVNNHFDTVGICLERLVICCLLVFDKCLNASYLLAGLPLVLLVLIRPFKPSYRRKYALCLLQLTVIVIILLC